MLNKCNRTKRFSRVITNKMCNTQVITNNDNYNYWWKQGINTCTQQFLDENYLSLEDYQFLNKSNYGCHNCLNCEDCTKCFDSQCLTYCIECKNCSYLNNCLYCDICVDCTNCRTCLQCVSSEDLRNLKNIVENL